MFNSGKALRVAMAMQNITIKDLAATLGVSRQQIHAWKVSESMNSATIVRLATVLNLGFSAYCKLGE